MTKFLLVVEGKTTNPPMLQIANFSKALVLITDASAVATAGCPCYKLISMETYFVLHFINSKNIQ